MCAIEGTVTGLNDDSQPSMRIRLSLWSRTGRAGSLRVCSGTLWMTVLGFASRSPLVARLTCWTGTGLWGTALMPWATGKATTNATATAAQQARMFRFGVNSLGPTAAGGAASLRRKNAGAGPMGAEPVGTMRSSDHVAWPGSPRPGRIENPTPFRGINVRGDVPFL